MSLDPTILEQVRHAEQEELRRLRAAREDRRKSVPPQALRWLALAPLWTADLAEAAEFPADGEPRGSLLERIHEAGLCEHGVSGPRTVLEGTKRRRAEGTPVYWLSRPPATPGDRSRRSSPRASTTLPVS